MARPAGAPLLLAALVACCSYCLLVGQAQAQVPPPRYDGFNYSKGAGAAWKQTVLVEGFMDPLCPDSRDGWWPLKRALERYGRTVSFVAHPYALPYHTYAFYACRALHIADKWNSSSTFPVWELFFNNLEKFNNSATWPLSGRAVTEAMSKLVAKTVGTSVPKFQSAFNESWSDWAARVSWKYGASKGVYGAPFYFVNGFLLPAGGSAIEYKTWVETLDPLVYGEGAG